MVTEEQNGIVLWKDMNKKEPIENWEVDWPRPKKPEEHWKDGRSAKELARSWFEGNTPVIPPLLLSLLHSHERFGSLRLIEGIPERKTPLPERGEARNHDLWLYGETNAGKGVTVCIEGKADEPFDKTIQGKLDYASQQERSGIPSRIKALLEMVGKPEDIWKTIRYQLLTAICGTAIQAELDKSSAGVLVIHEFRTRLTNDRNVARNQEDYKEFLKAMGADIDEGSSPKLYGPFPVAGIDCFIGKITTDLR